MSVESKKRLIILIISLGITILAGIYTYLYINVFTKKNKLQLRETPFESLKPAESVKFIKEGKVIFFNKENKYKNIQIDVEISDNPYEIVIGLMYRHFMPDKAGMLFIYKKSQPLVFWMKNTYIPLDIIFVDENMQIVKIQKNTKPLSEKLIPSNRNSMYVVEVNAGFCDKYGIKIGDYLSYERTLY